MILAAEFDWMDTYHNSIKHSSVKQQLGSIILLRFEEHYYSRQHCWAYCFDDKHYVGSATYDKQSDAILYDKFLFFSKKPLAYPDY